MNRSLAKCLCIFQWFGHRQAWTGAHSNQPALAASPKHSTLTQTPLSSFLMFLGRQLPPSPSASCTLTSLLTFGVRKAAPTQMFLTCVTVVGGAAPCANLSSPVAATVPLIPFLLFTYDVSGLQITSVPITTSSHNKYAQQVKPPLTCMPPCSYKVVLDPCFEWVRWTTIWPTYWVPLPPSGTTVEDAGRPLPLVPTPDPFASVNTGFSGRTEEILSVHENGLEKALGSCTHCGNMKRSVNKPRDTPPPTRHCCSKTHISILQFIVDICWSPFLHNNLLNAASGRIVKSNKGKITKWWNIHYTSCPH